MIRAVTSRSASQNTPEIISEITLGLLASAGILFALRIVTVFRNDPEVIRIGTTALRLHCIGLLFSPLSTITEMTYQGTGRIVPRSTPSSVRGTLSVSQVSVGEINSGSSDV